ncbi:hypothetical protein I7I51_01002 [Histoplasma capsulatum]|uniref:Transposase MuDR plant domain-containing protein n=1 Tax=Ajellomyces capsulatus TaxID=5037 RepID=A0A8A1MDE4_AJECA|nr:hypothetical protein I7I51_01002 [Histoplasma capsulatum]
MDGMYTGLQKRQLFESLDSFKSFVRAASIRQRWDLCVIRSNRESVALGCRSSTDCTFRAICRSNQNYTYVTSVTDTHTCRATLDAPAVPIQRAQASRMAFLKKEIPKFFDTNTKVTADEAVAAIRRYYGIEVAPRQAHRALRKLDMLKGKRRGRPPNPSQTRPVTGQIPIEATSSSFSQQQQQQQQQHQQQHDEHASEWSQNQPLLPMDIGTDDDDDDDFDVPESSHIVPQPSMPQPSPDSLARSHHVPTALNSGAPQEDQGSGLCNNRQHTPQVRSQPRSVQRRPKVSADVKVEFSCAACGVINQAFFPARGQVARTVVGNQFMGNGDPVNFDLGTHQSGAGS